MGVCFYSLTLTHTPYFFGERDDKAKKKNKRKKKAYCKAVNGLIQDGF